MHGAHGDSLLFSVLVDLFQSTSRLFADRAMLASFIIPEAGGLERGASGLSAAQVYNIQIEGRFSANLLVRQRDLAPVSQLRGIKIRLEWKRFSRR